MNFLFENEIFIDLELKQFQMFTWPPNFCCFGVLGVLSRASLHLWAKLGLHVDRYYSFSIAYVLTNLFGFNEFPKKATEEEFLRPKSQTASMS